MKKRILPIVLSMTLIASMFVIPTAVSAATVDTTGYSSKYTQDFSTVTNDAAGKAILNEYWEIQDINAAFGGADTLSTVDGALRFVWAAGRQITSLAPIEKGIVSFDVKLDSAAGPAVGQDIKGFAIRQIRNDGCFQSENDKYTDGTQPGLDGILFRLSANSITVVVDDTAFPTNADGVTSWSINSNIALPAGVSLDTTSKITVVDKGTNVQLYVGDALIATVELSNLVDGVYKTASIKDAAGAVLVSTTTANVPNVGKLAFGKREGSMDLDNINVMTEDAAVPIAADKIIIACSAADAQPIALVAEGKIGQTFTATEQFNTIELGICTWSTAKAGYTFEVRKNSPTGAVVFRHAYSNAVDNSTPVYVVGNLPAGTYYIEISKLVVTAEPSETEPAKMSQMGVWASKIDVDYAGGEAYLDGTAMTYDVRFAVKMVGTNANAVGNEYVAGENPVTSDLGAIQLTVMAVASAVVALKRKK